MHHPLTLAVGASHVEHPTPHSAFRRPGAELKEGFTPAEMLYANLGLTDTTSLEGFVQLKWRKTVPEGCGTYFSTSDFVADGCDRLAFQGGPITNPLSPLAGQTITDQQNFQFGTFVNRVQDRQPDDGGQFGLGAEVAVSTQMLHARGPMGLTELTSYKWVGQADYLIRA